MTRKRIPMVLQTALLEVTTMVLTDRDKFDVKWFYVAGRGGGPELCRTFVGASERLCLA